MKQKLQLLIAVFSLVLAASALAQPAAGDWEITLGGGGNADNHFNTGGFNLGGSFGYFLTDNWETGIRQSVGFSSSPDRWRGSTRGAVDYNFQLGKFVPFIGANLGYVYGEDFDNTWAAAPEIGLKYFVLDKTFIFATGEYQFFFRHARDIDNRFKDGQFAITFGVGFNLGRK